MTTPPAWTHSFVGRGKPNKTPKPRKPVTAREAAEKWATEQHGAGAYNAISRDNAILAFAAGAAWAKRGGR